MPDEEDSRPSATRERSYSGGYMKVGKAGEAICLSVLAKDPDIELIEDVSNDLDYQSRGIDVRFKLRKDGRWVTAEIKTDNHLDVGRCRWLFEVFRIYLTVPVDRAMVVGWSVRSEAEWLICYAPATRRLHFIKMQEYRQAHIEAVSLGKCEYSAVATDRIKRTLNGYFPEEFVHKQKSYRVQVVPEVFQPDQSGENT